MLSAQKMEVGAIIRTAIFKILPLVPCGLPGGVPTSWLAIQGPAYPSSHTICQPAYGTTFPISPAPCGWGLTVSSTAAPGTGLANSRWLTKALLL